MKYLLLHKNKVIDGQELMANRWENFLGGVSSLRTF